MDMKLRSGVKVTIQESGDSKLLQFDRPVKVMELSREESTRLGASLMEDCRVPATSEQAELIRAGRKASTSDKAR